MKIRHKEEILRDILAACKGGAYVTQVMFQAFVTHSQARGYLDYLVSNELVRYDALTRKYHATADGIEFVRAAQTLSELFPTVPRKSRSEEPWAAVPSISYE